MKRLLFSSLLFASLVAACVSKKPIGGQDCPCVDGYHCDELDGVCLPDGAAGTGGPSGVAGTGGPGTGVAGTGMTDYPPVAPGCGATCGTPAGTVVNPTNVADAYGVILGRWQFCDNAWQRGINVPADAIGVEFGPASTALQSNGLTKGGNLYFLVAGQTGPERGSGFSYQATYDIAPAEPLTIYVRQSGGGASVRFRYSPCPQELDVVVFYESQSSTMTRFSPGDGIKGSKDGGVDATPSPTDGPPSPTDAGVPTYQCQALPPGTSNTCGEAPRSFFGWTNAAPPSNDRYPVGCTAFLPVENPYSPGPRLQCDCAVPTSNPPGPPGWVCPL
jgi:hypothetical protein